MKIYIISQYFNPEIGAASIRWTEYSLLLAEMGHDVTVITSYPSYPSKKLYKNKYFSSFKIQKNNKYRIIRIWNIFTSRDSFIKRILYYVSFMISVIFRGLLLSKPDIYLASSPSLFVGLAGYVLSKLKNKPLVLDIRDLWPESAIELGQIKSVYAKNISFYLQYIIYKQTRVFITAVPGMKDYMVNNNKVVNKPILPLLNGISFDFFNKIKESEKKIDDVIKIVYSGNLGLAQDITTIINAAEKLNSKYQFHFIGDGIIKMECKNLVLKKSINNVYFHEPMERSQLFEKFRDFHIGIVSLKNNKLFKNAIPSKTFEYMANSLFVICMVKGEIEEVINKSDSGLCIESENPSLLVKALKLLDKNNIINKGKNGRRFIKENLIKENLIKDVINQIEATLIRNR